MMLLKKLASLLVVATLAVASQSSAQTRNWDAQPDADELARQVADLERDYARQQADFGREQAAMQREYARQQADHQRELSQAREQLARAVGDVARASAQIRQPALRGKMPNVRFIAGGNAVLG